MLSGTLAFPKDNSTTASCCSEVDPAGNVNGPGDKFEVCDYVCKGYLAALSDFFLFQECVFSSERPHGGHQQRRGSVLDLLLFQEGHDWGLLRLIGMRLPGQEGQRLSARGIWKRRIYGGGLAIGRMY